MASTQLPAEPSNVYIQDFGKLLISSADKKIVGISENFYVWTHRDASSFLNSSLEEFVTLHFPEKAKTILSAVQDILLNNYPRKLLLHNKQGKVYYLIIYLYDGHLYMEWEEQKSKSMSASDLNDFAFLFEKQPKHIWKHLCDSVQRMINYDRVFVLQTMETGNSVVISETVKKDVSSLRDKEFSPAFMPGQAVRCYKSRAYLFCQNLFKAQQKLYVSKRDIDLSACRLNKVPDVHDQYSKVLGVKSSMIFPIIIDDELWGLLVAHNHSEKNIDLQKRKLCSFIVQNAAQKFNSQFKQQSLEYQNQLKDIELALKEKFLLNNTIDCALTQSLEVLCETAKADGIGVYHQGDLFRHGLTPSLKQCEQIITFLRSQPKRPLFKDNNFKLRHGLAFGEELPFAGIMALFVGNQDDHIIVWFRRETVSTVQQMEQRLVEAKDTLLMEEATFYETWEKTIEHSAVPWSHQDIDFVRQLDKLINEAIIAKSKDQQKRHDELVALNNELEMLTFTLSHDLRNPLSIVKMGTQFLHTKPNLRPEEKNRWIKSMLRGIENIEIIISNIVHFNKSRTYKFSADPIPMAHTIKAICQETKLVYGSTHCSFELGELRPLWGEKSILYQIFTNLIGNAVKYSSRKKQPLVKVHSRVDGDGIVYVISDNGIGIPTESLKSIFDVFSRASNASAFKGSGLGLCIVKRLMDRLGGTIEVSSVEEQGTTVTLRFPLLDDFPASLT